MSPPLFAPAAADQRVRGVASGNQIALAIWDDGRSGAGDLYVTRIDANGVVLDPSGILIPNASGAKGVVWNGSAFIVIANDLIFVAPDGTILKRKPKSVTQFVASSGSGAGVRMLFVSGNLGMIFDGSGEIITSPVELWSSDPSAGFYAAAGSDGEFLVLYSVLGKAVFASRIDRNGKRLSSSVASGIDRFRVGQFPAVAGGANGWLVAGRATYQMTLYPLDGNGVLAGNPTTLENPQDIFDTVPPSIVSTNDGYIVTWTTNAPAMPYNANPPSAVTSVVRVSASGTPLAQAACGREMYSGGGYETAVTMIGSKWLILASEGRGNATGIDPIARLLTGTLDEIGPRFSVMSSATSQAVPRVASSKSNYAVLWTEYGPDATIHRFVRRFSLGATPIDAAPIEVSSDVIDYDGSAQIVAAGDTHLRRRLAGEWRIPGAPSLCVNGCMDRCRPIRLRSGGESSPRF